MQNEKKNDVIHISKNISHVELNKEIIGFVKTNAINSIPVELTNSIKSNDSFKLINNLKTTTTNNKQIQHEVSLGKQAMLNTKHALNKEVKSNSKPTLTTSIISNEVNTANTIKNIARKSSVRARQLNSSNSVNSSFNTSLPAQTKKLIKKQSNADRQSFSSKSQSVDSGNINSSKILPITKTLTKPNLDKKSISKQIIPVRRLSDSNICSHNENNSHLNISDKEKTLVIDVKHKTTNKIKTAEKRIITITEKQSIATVQIKNISNKSQTNLTTNNPSKKKINSLDSKKLPINIYAISNKSTLKLINNLSSIKKTLSDAKTLPKTSKIQVNMLSKINSVQHTKSITMTATEKRQAMIKPTSLVSTASRPSLIKTGSNTSEKNKPRWI